MSCEMMMTTMFIDDLSSTMKLLHNTLPNCLIRLIKQEYQKKKKKIVTVKITKNFTTENNI